MPSDDPNTTQNQDSTENSIPASPQEPIVDAPIPPIDSESGEAPPEVLESSPNDFSAKSNDIPPLNSTPTEAENEQKTEEKQAKNNPIPEPVSEPVEASEPETAQMERNEPLGESSQVQTQAPKNSVREILAKAQFAIQFRKRKKLDKIMALFLQHSKITNDEVEKFLHVSDATATRYLSQLEKEGKIKQSGKTGKGVSYSRI